MSTYFSCIESPLDLAKFTVNVTDSLCARMGPLSGSYRILPARLLGLDYVDYLYYVCNKYGENVYFPSFLGGPQFKNRKDAESFAAELNARAQKIFGEQSL